jgi:hypothetical protein
LLVVAEDLQMSDRRTLLFSMLTCRSSEDPKALPCDVQYILVLSMAFLGAYVWSLRSLFRRLVTVDLPPAAYYGFSIRLIFSPFIALLFAYLMPNKAQDASRHGGRIMTRHDAAPQSVGNMKALSGTTSDSSFALATTHRLIEESPRRASLLPPLPSAP